MASRQEQFHRMLDRLFSSRAGMQQEYVKARLNEFLTGDLIDVNQNYGDTHPLLVAIRCEHIAVAYWLLRHPQTVIPRNAPILFTACTKWQEGRSTTMISEIAIRPEIDLEYRGPSGCGYTALEQAWFLNKYEVAVSLIAAGASPVSLIPNTQTSTTYLVHQHQQAPTLTRQRCQLKRRHPMISAACLFGLVISIDDYWQYRRRLKKIYARTQRRFFTITRRLPIELQMLMCRRVYGLNGFNIPSSQLILPTALLLVASGEYTWV
jgi:hypothetical protein